MVSAISYYSRNLQIFKFILLVAGSHPPKSTFPPTIKPLTLPVGIRCGGVIEGMINGTFYSPNYPDHVTNQSCAWVIQVPDGYSDIQLTFPNFHLEKRYERIE